jgi:hypothetical protein
MMRDQHEEDALLEHIIELARLLRCTARTTKGFRTARQGTCPRGRLASATNRHLPRAYPSWQAHCADAGSCRICSVVGGAKLVSRISDS